MFVPFGFLLAAALRPPHWWIALLSAAAASAGIEWAQRQLLPERYASAADIAANTLGALVGIALCGLALLAAAARAIEGAPVRRRPGLEHHLADDVGRGDEPGTGGLGLPVAAPAGRHRVRGRAPVVAQHQHLVLRDRDRPEAAERGRRAGAVQRSGREVEVLVQVVLRQGLAVHRDRPFRGAAFDGVAGGADHPLDQELLIGRPDPGQVAEAAQHPFGHVLLVGQELLLPRLVRAEHHDVAARRRPAPIGQAVDQDAVADVEGGLHRARRHAVDLDQEHLDQRHHGHRHDDVDQGEQPEGKVPAFVP